jgi:hypothetical protein
MLPGGHVSSSLGKDKARATAKQIPFGGDNKKGKENDKGDSGSFDYASRD